MLRLVAVLALVLLAACSPRTRDGSLPVVEIVSETTSRGVVTFYVEGEVRNAGTTPVEFVRITASFYDENGSFIGSNYRFVETTRGALRPNETQPFKIPQSDPDRRIKSYKVAVSA